MIPGVLSALIYFNGHLMEFLMLLDIVISQGSDPSRDLLRLLSFGRVLEVACSLDIPGERLFSRC